MLPTIETTPDDPPEPRRDHAAVPLYPLPLLGINHSLALFVRCPHDPLMPRGILQWADFPNEAGLECLVLYDPDGGELLGWIMRRTNSSPQRATKPGVWSAFIPRAGTENPVNLVESGRLLGVMQKKVDAQELVAGWVLRPPSPEAARGSR